MSSRFGWIRYAIGVAGIHGLGFILLLLYVRQIPELLGMGFIAYTLGMRHAFDADHIAAIDNTVRKLTQQKSNSLGTGFFFSLGHSSVVFLMTLAAAVATRLVQQRLPQIQQTGALIGTVVSGVFLLFIGLLNLYIWVDLYRMFRKMRVGSYDPERFEALLLSRGLLARFVGPLYRLISKSWHIYPVGFLFGLGFDTASEVALLGISAAQSSSGLALWSIMVFPVLFAAGMSLVDTVDGVLMLGAYGWASLKPMRKLGYNISITGMSATVALLIGGVEALGLIGDKLTLKGTFWSGVTALNGNLASVGYLIVAVLIGSWIVSAAFHRLRSYSRVEIDQ